MINNKLQVLLCSPTKGIIWCGISRWTIYITDYYKTNKDNIELELFPLTRKIKCYDGQNQIVRLLAGIYEYAMFLLKLKRVLTKKKYDVLHLVSSASISLLKDLIMLWMASRKKTKTVIHFHFGRIPELYVKRNWEQKLLHWVISMADKVAVIDKESYDTLIQAGYTNVNYLPNPLAPVVSKIIGENIDIQKNENKIVYVGHVVPTKGVYELVKACREIPNINLKLIGAVDYSVKRDLYLEYENNSKNKIEIVGEQEQEYIIKEMLSARIFVLPSYFEGFPNVIIESMACGCSIIATSVGAIPEMLGVNEENPAGICVRTKDIEALRKGILRFLDNRALSENYGFNARKRVNEMYSIDIVCKKMESIWKSTIK
ncbi:MAG: hypothetical protein CVU10_10060 [Bacteroidetes bacterium HGW-Bacteroidetes-5]|nr:MAG: hypothetical protein CVU10_10060 [Bacteroidetes bacterium HGW-Bacteroidetes-5]